MTIKEVIEDHSLDKRLYVRRSEGDVYAGICPKCKNAGGLMLDPNSNTYNCRACGTRGDAYKLDRLIRKYGINKV